MEDMDKVKNQDYEQLKTIPLSEVQVFFSKKAYEELRDMGFTNVGDLLECDINGELAKKFYKRHKDAHELWSIIHGTIVVLKCKYLGIDPKIESDDKYKFAAKIGLSTSVRKRVFGYQSLQLPSLLKMVDKDDYSLLYFNFSCEVVDEIVNKIKVLSNYIKRDRIEPSIEDLKHLYEKLAFLVDEHEKIEKEIKIIQQEIEKRIKGGNHK